MLYANSKFDGLAGFAGPVSYWTRQKTCKIARNCIELFGQSV